MKKLLLCLLIVPVVLGSYSCSKDLVVMDHRFEPVIKLISEEFEVSESGKIIAYRDYPVKFNLEVTGENVNDMDFTIGYDDQGGKSVLSKLEDNEQITSSFTRKFAKGDRCGLILTPTSTGINSFKMILDNGAISKSVTLEMDIIESAIEVEKILPAQDVLYAENEYEITLIPRREFYDGTFSMALTKDQDGGGVFIYGDEPLSIENEITNLVNGEPIKLLYTPKKINDHKIEFRFTCETKSPSNNIAILPISFEVESNKINVEVEAPDTFVVGAEHSISLNLFQLGYAYDFSVQFTLTQGSGFMKYSGERLEAGKFYDMGSENELFFTPTSVGEAKLKFFVKGGSHSMIEEEFIYSISPKPLAFECSLNTDVATVIAFDEKTHYFTVTFNNMYHFSNISTAVTSDKSLVKLAYRDNYTHGAYININENEVPFNLNPNKTYSIAYTPIKAGFIQLHFDFIDEYGQESKLVLEVEVVPPPIQLNVVGQVTSLDVFQTYTCNLKIYQNLYTGNHLVTFFGSGYEVSIGGSVQPLDKEFKTSSTDLVFSIRPLTGNLVNGSISVKDSYGQVKNISFLSTRPTQIPIDVSLNIRTTKYFKDQFGQKMYFVDAYMSYTATCTNKDYEKYISDLSGDYTLDFKMQSVGSNPIDKSMIIHLNASEKIGSSEILTLPVVIEIDDVLYHSFTISGKPTQSNDGAIKFIYK